jgi:hypothetical protein
MEIPVTNKQKSNLKESGMKLIAPAFVVCLAMVALTASAEQTNKALAPSPERSSVRQRGNHRVPLIQERLRLSDFEGMKPRAGLKDKLLKISGFIQNAPRDGEPGTEKTEVWLGHTKNELDIVFVCHDHQTEEIRSHMTRREDIMHDDNVTVILDPFQDHRKGVLFKVNPAGVQADAAWSDLVGPDFSYDLVWDSEGQVTSDGWMALMSIPFRSLRFRAGSSNWGVVFIRNLPRNSEMDFWPRVAADTFGILSQEGTLEGIDGVEGSHNVQFNPYALGQNERTLETLDPLHPSFSSRHIEGTAGGDAKVILNDSIVVDATVNPDFSDIESEQPQFTVNQRYAVYFPELRPFFLENANYFATPIQLVYTRNIGHPEFGLRATGKLGPTNIGLIAIDDRAPGETVAPGDPLYHKRATFAVGRISRDFGEGSSIGAIYTDREFGQGWNRAGGVDFTARFKTSWMAQGQWVLSSTQGTQDSGSPPSYAAGPASDITLRRTGRKFGMNAGFTDYSSGFQSQTGFIPTANIRSGGIHATYKWFPTHKLVQSYGLETHQSVAFDHQGNRVSHYSTFGPFFSLPRSTMIVMMAGQNSDTLGPQNGTLLKQNRNFTENFGGIIVRSSPLPQFNFRLSAFHGGNVNYNPITGGVPSLMNQDTAEFMLTAQPFHRLTADNTYLLDRDRSVAGDALVYESQTFRTRINYQFTQALSARAIVEYDSTLANPAQTSLLRKKEVGTEALVTWLPHPGTAIYVGYNNDMQNLDRSLCNRLPGGACDPNNLVAPRASQFLNDGRQIYIKASYLFRF